MKIFKDTMTIDAPLTVEQVQDLIDETDKKELLSKKVVNASPYGLFIISLAFMGGCYLDVNMGLMIFISNVLAAIAGVFIFDVFVRGFVRSDFNLLDDKKIQEIRSWAHQCKEIDSFLLAIQQQGRRVLSVDYDQAREFFQSHLDRVDFKEVGVIA
ncbi:hypothetical protein [Vibrio owensii]|uniref:hypothetical protein n=1 Tax=Vibrio harveyi group TaxID=717610 RepID=UPI003CC663EA